MSKPSFIPVLLTVLLLTVGGVLPSYAQPKPQTGAGNRAEPEPATGRVKQGLVRSSRYMAVTANPYASSAGLYILRQGGSAVDAAIAIQMVLNLVEPQSSGIGGGAFLVHWDAAGKNVTTFDGRETAPLKAMETRFLRPDGAPLNFRDAIFGGLSVGMPGTLRVLELAHRRHGRLPWKTLFKPAIAISNYGFTVSPRLHDSLRRMGAEKFGPTARKYFFSADGAPRPAGYLLKNPALGRTFQRIADEGAGAFYDPRGEIAGDIRRTVQQHRRGREALIEGQDFLRYRAIERPPVCTRYRGYRICGMGPPSSGALTIAQVLKLIEPYDLGREPLNPRALHLIAEAEKLSYADRGRYMADADFVPVPRGLLHPQYVAARRTLIDPARAMSQTFPGNPPLNAGVYGKDATIENNGTSHISIVDAWGNALSMTTTIESGFGARIMTGGFLLNNELTDFSFSPRDKEDRPIANRVGPGKRPRSSMAPTLVFAPDGRLKAVLGSPGGSRIILYVLKAIIGLIDWNLDAQQIADLPNFGSRGKAFEMEDGPLADQRAALLRLGHKIRTSRMTSGLHAIVTNNGKLEGGADPRREGLAVGD